MKANSEIYTATYKHIQEDTLPHPAVSDLRIDINFKNI